MTDLKHEMIQKGKVLVYRVFDVGDEIDLNKTTSILNNSSSPLRFKLKKDSRAMIIKDAPVHVSLGGWQYNIFDEIYDVEIIARIWQFGVVSIIFNVNLPANIQWSRLQTLSTFFDSDTNLHKIAEEKTNILCSQIFAAIKNPTSSTIFEDYVVYFIEKADGLAEDATRVFNHVDVYSLLLAERKENLSDGIKKIINDGIFQYERSDLAVIDWNSALLIEPSGSFDVADTIEFALCQLLEMRYYDDILDERLKSLYNSLDEKKRPGIFSNRFSKISEEAAQKYLEISELVESAENSLKVVGDFYLANIFRAASNRFRFKDWQSSVDNKLNNLAEVSKLLHSEVNEKRALILESIIVILIALEMIPLIIDLKIF